MIDLYPAIDLRGGRCVRLYQGDFDRETVFADDPPTQARLFADQGATWMHVVDLDAARTGEPVNRAVVAAIAAAVDVPVQSGGGVRSTDAARALSESGVRRVVIGTAALTHPELVAEVSGLVEVAVGLDVRGREVSVAGWQQGSGLALSEVLPRFEGAGASSVIVTQIEVDGTGRGPDLETYREVLALTELPVVASGGVGTLDHLHQLDALVVGGRSLSGVIVGRALYDGAFTLADALSAVS